MIRRTLIPFAILLAFPIFIQAQVVYPNATWETRTPEEVCLDSNELTEFVNILGGTGGVIIRDGYLVKSWSPTVNADWFSAVKPMYSMLLFRAVELGLLNSTGDLIRPYVLSRFGQDLIPSEQDMTFADLANNISGYERGESPGEAWGYNDLGIKLFGLLLLELYGKDKLLDAFTEQFAADLQLQDGNAFCPGEPSEILEFRGCLSPRDFARIGWLFLNRGRWKSQQLIDESVFDNLLMPQVPADLPRTTLQGTDYLNVGTVGGDSNQRADGPGVYGYNIWFNEINPLTGTRLMPDLPPDAYQFNGLWGYGVVLIIPSLNMVVAARGNWGGLEKSTTEALMEAVLTEQACHTAKLDLQVMLQGAYNGAGEMSTDLNASGHIPLNQPYNVAPWNYAGTESVPSVPNGDVVDWVLVSLRSNTTAVSTVATRAGFLLKNGHIVDLDGVSPLAFQDMTLVPHYAVIQHRNHLSIMTKDPISLSALTSTLEIAKDPALVYGDDMKDMEDGFHAMYGGDANKDGQILYIGSARDQLEIISLLGTQNLASSVTGYHQADLNLNGSVHYIGALRDQLPLISALGLAQLANTIISNVPN